MKNKITDLRNHLFAQIERLNDEDITPEQLEEEIKKSKAIATISKVIVDSAKVEVAFVKANGGTGSGFLPEGEDVPERKALPLRKVNDA